MESLVLLTGLVLATLRIKEERLLLAPTRTACTKASELLRANHRKKQFPDK